MIKKIIATVSIFFAFMTVLAFFLYRTQHAEKVRGKLSIVCTTGMIADAIKNVGGDLVDVHALMGPGVDPHVYHARESDVQRLASADIIFYNGLHLEGKMGQIFNRMRSRIPVCAVTDGIDRSQLRKSGFEDTYDPHVWFDITLWMECVKKIRDCLREYDPIHDQEYTHNAQTYLKKMEELDIYIRDRVKVLPENHKVLITAHDAFSYFGRAYGFEIVSLQGISTDSEVGTGDVMRVVNYIVKNGVPAIFVEASIPQRNIEAVQNAVRAQSKEVILGPTLYSDSLGESGTIQETYLGMVRSVVESIVATLQGKGVA